MARSSARQVLAIVEPSAGAPGAAAAASTEVGVGRSGGSPREQGPPPRRRHRWVLASLVGVLVLTILGLLAALRPAAELPGTVRDPAPEVHGLRFVDHSAPAGPREVDVIPAGDHLTLLYFGYLSCPDVCPMTMVDIARAKDQLTQEQAARIQVAFVTLDPQRDDPARLRAYLDLFLDGTRLPLTAADDRTLDDAREQLGLRYEIEPHDPGDETYDVAHSALTYVIDDTGTVVRELPFGVTPDEIAAVLRAHLA
jgi:cytochrome oxidase Cu insertion factor (SCO1/SenC/PrrC family)